MFKIKFLLLSVFFFLSSISCLPSFAQDTSKCKFFTPSETYNKKRATYLIVGEASLYGGIMYGLNQLWYAGYPRSSFHFFNDNREWNQVDKIGHACTAYVVGKAGIDVWRWAGAKDKKAIWLGGTLGFVFLTTIETLDGFSEKWGASAGDLTANTSGALLVIGQELLWKEQRIAMKFSSHKVDYSPFSDSTRLHAKELYGKNFAELIMKDYNGQTYWLSANISSFLAKENRFPKWLNIAVGYGAEQMFCGHEEDCENYEWKNPKRFRQFYLSPDIDLTKIKNKSHLFKAVLSVLNVFKFPAPALEYNSRKEWKWHWIYF